jgi:RHS repeat-associated protein
LSASIKTFGFILHILQCSFRKPSTGETTVFVYDASGKLVSEYSTLVTPQQDAKVSYLTADHLGSPRINTDQNGLVTARHDYQPFGEEIARASYGADTVRKQFTSYERDDETELDFAEARMYSSKLGRFTSVDPKEIAFETKIEKIIEYVGTPQNWNRYVYVRNNPLALTDLDGREPNKAQAGTTQQIVAVIQQIEKQNPGASNKEVLQKTAEYFRNMDDSKAGSIRYVYTEKAGWIDFKHFFAAAEHTAINSYLGEVETNIFGLGVEGIQMLKGDDSAFSYEDLGSNYQGSRFGGRWFETTGNSVSSQVESFLDNTLQARSPQAANNYNQLPAGPPNANGSRSTQVRGSRTTSTQSGRTQSNSTRRNANSATDSNNSAGKRKPMGRKRTRSESVRDQ